MDQSKFMRWLSAKSLAWHQHFYALLYVEMDTSGSLADLAHNYVIRLENGKYSNARQCFFADKTDEDDGGLPRVAVATYTSGKSKAQQENSRKCLENLGVRKVGEAEQIEAVLQQRYGASPFRPRKSDLARFVALVEKEPARASLFANYFILEREDGKWGRPCDVYLDSPIKPTDLRSYHEALGGSSTVLGLHPRYYQEPSVPVAKLRAFMEKVGVQVRLEFIRQNVNGHRDKEKLLADYYLPNVKWREETGINRDWTLSHLDRLLATPSRDISRLLWNTMREAAQTFFYAEFRPNQQYETRREASSLILNLQQAAWIPQLDGRFVRPAQALRDQLPSGFAFDPGDQWLNMVLFGKEENLRSEEHQRKRAMAEHLGFPDADALARAQQFAALPPDEQAAILAEFQRRSEFNLPDHQVRNLERRVERVASDAAIAPERLTEERTRSISIGREEVKGEAVQYLRDQYTNTDGVMICQVCRGPLPFKLDNGHYYFEAVEFLPKLKRRHRQNYLALCPNHGAMYMHANDLSEDLQALFLEMSGQSLEIVLAQGNASVHFTQVHLHDMRTIIGVDAKDAVKNEETDSH